MRFSLSMTLLLVGLSLHAQYISSVTVPDSTYQRTDDNIWQLAQTITQEDLRHHMYILASDSFGGRELGTEGNLLAADYISNTFKDLGISTINNNQDYYQKVDFTWLSWADIKIHINGDRYKQLWDFISFPDKNQSADIQTNEVVFVGYGLDSDNYSDYAKANVKDKVVLFYDKEPKKKNGKYLTTGTSTPGMWSDSIQLKLAAAAKHGAKHALIIADNIKELVNNNRKQLLGPKVLLGPIDETTFAPINYTYISSTMAKALLGDQIQEVIKARKCIQKKGKYKPVNVKTDLHLTQQHRIRSVDGVNVAGMIKGSTFPDEYVLVSAHYDHIGKKGKDINNGADDNASGTSTVIELAQAFKIAQDNGLNPKRSVVFLLVTGEEKGLLGSEFYVEKPLVPLEQSIVDINIDMVGRIDKKYEENPEYIYVIGSDRLSTELHEVNEAVNRKYAHLTLDYTYNSEKDPNRFYYRSDHYNFAKKGIPAIFFFNGTHEDYHRPSDTVEKIAFDKMTDVARHIFTLTYTLADMDQAIKVNVTP